MPESLTSFHAEITNVAIMFFGLMGLGVLGIYVIYRVRCYKQNMLLQSLAEQYSGQVNKDKIFSFPCLEFSQDDLALRVYSIHPKRRQPPRTIIECTYSPSKEIRVRLFRESFLDKIEKVFGMQDIKIGNSQFDETYIIQGNNEEVVLEFLREDIQKTLQRIAVAEPMLEIGGERLMLSVPRYLKDEDQYQTLIQLALDSVRQFRAIPG